MFRSHFQTRIFKIPNIFPTSFGSGIIARETGAAHSAFLFLYWMKHELKMGRWQTREESSMEKGEDHKYHLHRQQPTEEAHHASKTCWRRQQSKRQHRCPGEGRCSCLSHLPTAEPDGTLLFLLLLPAKHGSPGDRWGREKETATSRSGSSSRPRPHSIPSLTEGGCRDLSRWLCIASHDSSCAASRSRHSCPEPAVGFLGWPRWELQLGPELTGRIVLLLGMFIPQPNLCGDTAAGE